MFLIIEILFYSLCIVYAIANKKVLKELNQRIKFLEEKS